MSWTWNCLSIASRSRPHPRPITTTSLAQHAGSIPSPAEGQCITNRTRLAVTHPPKYEYAGSWLVARIWTGQGLMPACFGCCDLSLVHSYDTPDHFKNLIRFLFSVLAPCEQLAVRVPRSRPVLAGLHAVASPPAYRSIPIHDLYILKYIHLFRQQNAQRRLPASIGASVPPPPRLSSLPVDIAQNNIWCVTPT